MWEMHAELIGKPEMERPLRRCKGEWEDNNENKFYNGIGFEDVDWFDLA
jgi:hypothetical protein